jgi:glyoxylase-like metal-dependent hydrolase (beta-lactamase superfamily II)
LNWNRVLAIIALVASPLAAQSGSVHRPPKPPKSLRIYVLDCGGLKVANPAMFGFKKEELAVLDLAVPCYLIAHPNGTLMWDAGVIGDSDLKTGAPPALPGVIAPSKTLTEQLASTGYTPADITYLSLSHYHLDHTANANLFAGSTWLVSRAEHDAMFSDKPPLLGAPPSYSALKDSKTTILPATADYDVFGDGKVIIKPAPGHTPGHQVLFLKLAKTGPILVAGDLYHYQEERTAHRVPGFDVNKEQSLASRAMIEEFLKTSGAQLWIEHDYFANAKLKKAPAYYE